MIYASLGIIIFGQFMMIVAFVAGDPRYSTKSGMWKKVCLAGLNIVLLGVVGGVMCAIVGM